MRPAILCVRVSSEEQSREGHSLAAQLASGRDYCARHDLEITDEIVETASAKSRSRPEWRRLMRRMREPSAPRVLVYWSIDRVTRNWSDYAEIDALRESGVEVHLAASGVVAGPDADAGLLLMLDVQMAAARSEVKRLSQRVRAGMEQKRRSGGWNHRAPLGLANIRDERGRATLTIDVDRAPLIRAMFDRYARGSETLESIARHARELGLRSRSGRVLGTAALSHLLRHPALAGYVPIGDRVGAKRPKSGRELELVEAEWPPVVPRETWRAVQEILDGRARRKGPARSSLPMAGIFRCASCGCGLSWWTTRGRYVYGRCSRAMKRRGCSEPAIRDVSVVEQVAEMLDDLDPTAEGLDRVRRLLRVGAHVVGEEAREQRETIRRQQDAIERRLETAYQDRLDERITAAHYDRIASSARADRDRLARAMAALDDGSQHWREEALRLMTWAREAGDRLRASDVRSAARALRGMALTAEIGARKVGLEWTQVLAMVADTARAATLDGGAALSADPSWLTRRWVDLTPGSAEAVERLLAA